MHLALTSAYIGLLFMPLPAATFPWLLIASPGLCVESDSSIPKVRSLVA